jgi:enoyl-[acyl-carrier-protein] reductase (NADH)
MDLRLEGKTVAGASQGIGEGVARARYPLTRPAHVHEITDLIVFLASYRSGYTSGTIFTVDGGIASRRSVI